jgi:hypothetical protein
VSDPIISPRGRLFRFFEACEYLGGMKESRLRQLVARQAIPVHRDGRLGFWQRDLDEWMERHRTPALDERKSKHLEVAVMRPAPTGIEHLMPRKRRLSRAS